MTEAMTDSTVLPFDTLAAHRELTAAGMPGKQADALVHIHARLLNGSLATKADLKELQHATETGLNTIEARLNELQNATDARFKELQTTTDARFKELQTTTDARFDATDARFGQLEANLEKKIATTSVDMVKWSVGFQIGIGAIIIAVLKLL